MMRFMKCKNCSNNFDNVGNKKFCCLFCRIKYHSFLKENGCWESTLKSCDKKGYSKICMKNRRMQLSHRVMYEQYYKTSLISCIKVCHQCDNPKCVNPE